MDKQYQNQLDNLKKTILEMGSHVEEIIQVTCKAILEKNSDGFSRVQELEGTINLFQVKVDEAALELLARLSPRAMDLRFVISVLKINSDLERMGDEAVKMSYAGKSFISHSSVLPEIHKMVELVSKMVTQSLNSFVNNDAALAKSILLSDDEVDELKRSVTRKMIAYIKQTPHEVESSLDLMSISKTLERIGDHATNIAEDVIFTSTGKDIRHHLGDK